MKNLENLSRYKIYDALLGDLIKFIGSNKEKETNKWEESKISEIVLRLKEIFEKNRELIGFFKKNID